MSDFNAAKGELVPGRLALVVGCAITPVNIGMIVTTVERVNTGHMSSDGFVYTGKGGWFCEGDGLSVLRDGVPVVTGYSYIRDHHLSPITPEPDPLQVQTEKEQLV